MFPTMSLQHIKADKGFYDSGRIVMAREDFSHGATTGAA